MNFTDNNNGAGAYDSESQQGNTMDILDFLDQKEKVTIGRKKKRRLRSRNEWIDAGLAVNSLFKNNSCCSCPECLRDSCQYLCFSRLIFTCLAVIVTLNL